MREKQTSLEKVLSTAALLIGGDKGCVNLGTGVGIFRVIVHHRLMLRCWECFICMKRNSMGLLNMSL